MPTHILPPSTSCTELIFTNQPNAVINSGVHPSLHQTHQHQIIVAHYPSPYKLLVWDYKKANIDVINWAIKSFNWQELLNETLMNIFINFISNKIKTFRDSDPPWMNDDIKNKVKLKYKLHNRYLRHQKNNEDFTKLEGLRNETDNII